MFRPIKDYYTLLCKEKKLELEIENEISINTMVTGDEKRISQILQHLIANAYKYTSKGTISVTLYTTKAYQHQYLEFIVRDTGNGIPEYRQPNLFRMFRMDFRQGINNQGIGLGLMLVKGITDAMRGEVTFVSHEGLGSEFKVKLRVNKIEEL